MTVLTAQHVNIRSQGMRLCKAQPFAQLLDLEGCTLHPTIKHQPVSSKHCADSHQCVSFSAILMTMLTAQRGNISAQDTCLIDQLELIEMGGLTCRRAS